MRKQPTLTCSSDGKDSITLDSPAAPPRQSPATRFLQSKYRKLTRKHLGLLLDRLFADFTDLHYHIVWASATPEEWSAEVAPAACSICCRLVGTSLKAQPVCRKCGPRQLARALRANAKGLAFTCRLGVLNHWIPLRVRNVTVAIIYLQALNSLWLNRALPGRTRCGATKVMDQSAFRRAGRLLRLIVEHVQTLDLAELRKLELSKAGHAVLALEKEQARLHEVLQRHLPVPPEASRRAGSESRPEQIVHHLLECIQQNYRGPITMQNCASKLGLNASYASALFSRAVGVPFKTHLTELRMKKAKQLLGDPAMSASHVASAVGYNSENRFRIAFKKATGLSPKLWRETMQTSPTPS